MYDEILMVQAFNSANMAWIMDPEHERKVTDCISLIKFLGVHGNYSRLFNSLIFPRTTLPNRYSPGNMNSCKVQLNRI
jgi:hypothetical protein